MAAGKAKRTQRIGWSGAIGLGVGATLALVALAAPALAQGRSIFDTFFGPFSAPRYAPAERPADFTRAPPPRKVDTAPTSTIVVFGDSMADWLAYGLEDALAETPEFGVVRKNRAASGLIRYDARNENLNWAQVVREAIAAEKPKFVIMMVGLHDRQAIRERLATRQPGGAGGSPPLAIVPPLGTAAGENADTPREGQDVPDQPTIAAPERGRGSFETYEFRTEQWAEQYTKRVDATIAALQSGGVPVFWVGLPSLRGPKSTSDMLYLNDIFRTRAEKAGITYIDVWDGFVDENGRYVVHGPDFEGQTRRLRVSDGVHFTKAGARKLAHYVEREIRRVIARGLGTVALPTSEPPVQQPVARPGTLAARPLAGPVIPLTAIPSAAEGLAGGSDARTPVTLPSVSRVLVKGEALPPPAGRSDDFVWPRRGVAPFGSDPVVATTTDPVVVMRPAAEATVSAPKVDTRAIATSSARRTTGRAAASPPPQRRTTNTNTRQFSILPFGR